MIGDPEADALVARMGRDVWAVNRLLESVVHDGSPWPDALERDLVPIVLPAVPAWADRHRITRAQRFAEARLLPITVALFCAALPASYCAVEGARLLRTAGRMTDDLDRRVNETARFVLDVLRPGSFERGGRARVVLGKVRLVHAAVRAALRTETYVPIHQEEQVGTLGLFSVVVLKSLVRLGIEVDAREREDFVHLWCVAGSMMGVLDIPTHYADFERRLRALAKKHNGPSEDGVVLMAALLEGMRKHMPVPFLPERLVRYLLGDPMSSWLGLGDDAARSLDLSVLPSVGASLLDAVTAVKLRGERTHFAMP